MSQGFGVDIYGIDFYGYSQSADYSVAPFVAKQTDYGDITLSWASPNVTSWKVMELVRSVYGYANKPEDGVVLTTIFPGTVVRTYDDPGLSAGVIYYYSMFISVEAPTWNSGTTYNLNNQVLYNGLYWTSIQNSNTNNTPAAGSAFWSPTNYIPTWYPAGYAATLALGNQGFTSLLYGRTPEPYKTNTSDTFSNTSIDNTALFNYESLFGFGLDMLKGEYDSYLQLNDADKVSAAHLDILGQQLGINSDYLSTPQQRRQRVKNASTNYRLKGTEQSIHNLIAELAGWDSDITLGRNLMNGVDQSNFLNPIFDVWSSNTTYFPGQKIQYNGYNYTNLVQSKGQAQAPTGTGSANTWWSAVLQTLDTTVNKNPGTGSYSTWSLVNDGTTASITGVMTGLPSPTDSTIHNYGALATSVTAGGLLGGYYLFSDSPINTPNYSNSTNYVAGNFVLYTDGYYYKALLPNGPATAKGVVAPNLNALVWQPFYYTTSDTPNVVKDGFGIESTPLWNTATQYQEGDVVIYLGITYKAAIDNIKSAPSGYYYSNSSWIFIGLTQRTFTASSYAVRVSSSGTVGSFVDFIFFYDNNGLLINNTSPLYTGYNIGFPGVAANFVTDYTDLAGTTEPSLANAETGGTLTSGTWVSTPATATLWRTSYGMASVNQTIAGTTTYVYSLVTPAVASTGRVGITFTSDYVDTAHKTHGIVFGYVDASNFYYATRTSLRKVVAGVDSVMASWTRLNDGDRMIVDVDVVVQVMKYARDGKATLTTLANVGSGGPTAIGKIGLIQKYSASGAL